MHTYRKKVCLVGAPAVGKTSLILRYVKNAFNERYLRTLGTRVYSKTVTLPAADGEGPDTLILSIWDIMGQRGAREMLQQSYFFGAHGIMAVADITRPETYQDLWEWIGAVRHVVGGVPVQLAVNKVDLAPAQPKPAPDVRKFAEAVGCRARFTSAKTGENVETAFQMLCAALLDEPPKWSRTIAAT